jgi:hypothetical protein
MKDKLVYGFFSDNIKGWLKKEILESGTPWSMLHAIDVVVDELIEECDESDDTDELFKCWWGDI